MSEQVDDVSISCDEDLTVECEQVNATLQWNFQVETEVRFLQQGMDVGSVLTIYSVSRPP